MCGIGAMKILGWLEGESKSGIRSGYYQDSLQFLLGTSNIKSTLSIRMFPERIISVIIFVGI